MRCLLTLMIVMVLAGCKDQDALPAGVLPQEKMKLVMYDMMRSGEFLSGYVLYKDETVDKTGESMKWYNKVWQMHHITEDQFRQSYKWYREHPKQMEQVMDSVMIIPTPPNPEQPADSSVGKDSVTRRQLSPINPGEMQRARAMRFDSLRARGILRARKDSGRAPRRLE
jgi:hypothetical protein